ncbi:MAG TPA: non-canonical purine NTP pyrophosphatase, partial [Candidatus Binataceae bacterium]|nr:non-canonical purine NTP pyrophosphatase [Candidatus Binataceae bacterium]
MKPLLVATTNPAKLDEYRLLLRGFGLAPLSLREAGLDDRAPEETGATFVENALLKARFYFARANLTTIADDGGLMVDALGGEPGVRSHRWLGGDAAAHRDLDRALADEVIRRMAGVEPARRGARLRAAAALVYREHGREHGPEHGRENLQENGWEDRQEDGQEEGRERVGRIHERVSEAALEGVIADRVWPRMRKGFPYRAVLFLPERGCYLGELSDEDAARLSQRHAAL